MTETLDAMEWMPDDFSPGCLICQNPWTMKRRRHHCRRCGRLVCKECSSRTMKLYDSQEPQRVCDECCDNLEIKKKVQLEANYQREREVALLNATSKVSNSLCRIYFLDGSFKTVFYDETVTAQDITAKICFSVKIALFEVERDIKDSTQYCLISPDECIGDIIVRWGRNGLDCAKLVVPIYDVSSSLRGKAPPSLVNTPSAGNISDNQAGSRLSISYRGSITEPSQSAAMISGSFSRSVSISVPTTPERSGSISSNSTNSSSVPAKKRSSFSFLSRSSKSQSDILGKNSNQGLDGIPESNSNTDETDGALNGVNDLSGFDNGKSLLEEELNTLRKELFDLQKKYNILRSIHVKREKTERQKLKDTSRIKPPSIAPSSTPAVPSNDEDDMFTPANPHTTPSNQIEKESSEAQSISPSSSIQSGNELGSLAKSQNTNKQLPNHQGDKEVLKSGLLQKKKKFTTSRGKQYSSYYFILKTDGFLYYYSNPEDSLKKNGESGKWDVKKCVSMVDPKDECKISLTLPGKKISLLAENLNEANSWVKSLSDSSASHGYPVTGPLKINISPSSILHPTSKSNSSKNNKSDNQDDDITTVMKQSSSHQVKVFLDKVQEVELFFLRFDEILYGQFQHGVSDPQQMYHMYEIISAMQSLYGNLLHYGEQWSADTRDWLLRMLRQKMSLPIEEPELLMAVIQCLTRENMLFSPETVNTVNQVIEMSFEQGTEPCSDSTIEGVLNSVSRMVETLDQVVEDLMPILPDDFNVITMFQEKANRKIKTDIKTFYATHKESLNNRDLLTLLSFADSQMHTLEKFGVDTKVISDLNTDLLRQYISVSQQLMKTWMGRIHEADIKPDVECRVRDGIGQSTHWPGDLMSCLGEHLNLAIRELSLQASEKVVCPMMDMLPDFITLQRHWAETAGRNCPPERICAYINNMRYFAHLLHEKQLSLSEEIYDSCRINDVFAITIKPFLTEADSSVSLLINIVTADFREGLQDGLFKNEWFQSKSVVETLKITLLEYLNDLKVWLKKENDIKLVLIGVLRVVSGSYLEFLLLSGMNITGGINERLQQDYEIIQQSFRECGPYLQYDIIDRELKPLNDVILVLQMDLRRMAQFIRNDLYVDFGSSCMKIWQTIMIMRDESKQVQDAVYEAITKGWVPTAINPLLDITYLDKLKTSQTKNRISIRLPK